MDAGAQEDPLDSSESREDTLERLTTLLRLVPGAWVVVVAEGDRLIEGILQKLGESLAPLRVVELSLIHHEPDPLSLAEGFQVDHSKEAPVLAFRHLAPAIPRIFLNLDLKREALAQLPHRLVFFVSESERLAMLAQAPNFYSRLRAFFRFRPEEGERPHAGTYELTSNPMGFQGGRLYRLRPAADPMSERDRVARIRRLQLRFEQLASEANTDADSLGRILLDIADLESDKQPEEAEEFYRQAAAAFSRAGSSILSADALLSAGVEATKAWRLEAAFDHFRTALDLIRELSSPRLEAEGLLLQAEAEFQASKVQEAEANARRALEIFEKLEDEHSLARTLTLLGILSISMGRYGEGAETTRKALEIFEKLGNRAGMAISYHQLGVVAQERGDDDQALDWYRKSLAISEELGNRAGMASSYHQLGIVAQKRGDFDQALDWYRKSLAIEEELGNRAGMAISYHQLGMVAQDRGDDDQALDWYRKSLAISEELGNRAGMAISYHQLGRVAQERGDFDQALDWYRKSLAISEELGNRAGMTSSLSQIGILHTTRGRPGEAVSWNLRSLAIRLELQVPLVRIDLHWLNRQRELLGDDRFRDILANQLDPDSQATVLEMLDQFAAQSNDLAQ